MKLLKDHNYTHPANAAGLLTTRMTESPLKNILDTYRSLFIAEPLCLSFPPLEYSVHISLTSSNSLYCVYVYVCIYIFFEAGHLFICMYIYEC